MTTATTPIYQPALDRGLSIIPIPPREKGTKLQDWPERARNDDSLMTPGCNYGVVANDTFCILDIDNLEVFRGELGIKLPATYTVKTSRGLHLYFRHTDRSRKLGNKGAGIFDFQADRKYVVGEGSLHPSGYVYTCIDASPIIDIPDSLVEALDRFVVERKRQRKNQGLKAGDRSDMLEYAGRIFTTGVTEEEMFEMLQKRNETTSEELLSDGDLARMVQHAFKKWEHAKPGGPVVLVGAPKLDGTDENCTGEDYVLGPAASAKFEGWFPLGEVSLIAGSSGAGKTTWALQMLDAQAKGEPFLGHRSFGLPYIMVMQDRSEFAMRRTFRRLEMDMTTVPWRRLPPGSDDRDPGEVMEELYKAETRKPRIMFMEGLDIWIPENFKMDVVKRVLKSLQLVAERYNLAIIATLGSPKRSKKDQYESPRDAVYGSSVFARMTETIVKVSEDYETGARMVLVLPRQEKSEKFETVMRDGRMVVHEGIHVDITPGPTRTQEQAFAEWLTPESTWEQAHERFGICRRTFFKWKGKINNLESARTPGCTPKCTVHGENGALSTA